MSDKPTGVFVRLPLSEERAITFHKESSHAWDEFNGSSNALACEAGLFAIGTPVTVGKEICVGSVKWHENDREPTLETYVPNAFGRGTSVKIVTLSDHQAQLAALEAEVVRLREVLTKLDYAAHELEQTEAAQSIHQLAHICVSLLSNDGAIRKSAIGEWEALKGGAA